MPVQLPKAFADIVSDGIPGILQRQQPDGSIIYDPAMPFVYPQQAIMPLAFCYAGLGSNPEHKNSPVLLAALRKLGDFLVARTDDEGRIHWDSHGHDVNTVDQRLTYAWVEGLRMAREAGADLSFDQWGDKIQRACNYLIERRLKKLVGVRRFISRVLGTSTNHAALYVTTVYRTGQVLNRKDLCEFVLPIGRALAADIHPDGYYEEHGDLLRNGGPTPSYNYLTHCGNALMAEWTGEKVFLDANEKSTRFHANFCYPDASFFELIDERVRHDLTVPRPRVWGLFGFSRTPEGRGVALKHFETWMKNKFDHQSAYPETLARHVENALYWHDGPIAPAPFENKNHFAKLTMPAAIANRGPWSIGVSAMRAINPEDAAYRDNPFGLDRQKLFSVWHEKTGLVLDGSHSKNQKENSTFWAHAEYATDYYPAGGDVGQDGKTVFAKAAYKTFFGEARLKVLSDNQLEIELSIDPAGNRGPFTAGFTVRRFAEAVQSSTGNTRLLTEPFDLTGPDLGGSFSCGPVKIAGPQSMHLQWPFSPFNSYAATGKAAPEADLLRVYLELTPENPRAKFTLTLS